MTRVLRIFPRQTSYVVFWELGRRLHNGREIYRGETICGFAKQIVF